MLPKYADQTQLTEGNRTLFGRRLVFDSCDKRCKGDCHRLQMVVNKLGLEWWRLKVTDDPGLADEMGPKTFPPGSAIIMGCDEYLRDVYNSTGSFMRVRDRQRPDSSSSNDYSSAADRASYPTTGQCQAPLETSRRSGPSPRPQPRPRRNPTRDSYSRQPDDVPSRERQRSTSSESRHRRRRRPDTAGRQLDDYGSLAQSQQRRAMSPGVSRSQPQVIEPQWSQRPQYDYEPTERRNQSSSRTSQYYREDIRPSRNNTSRAPFHPRQSQSQMSRASVQFEIPPDDGESEDGWTRVENRRRRGRRN
ncbi:hypothetical protein V8F06_014956 [Rhypophila decipiens]